MKKYFLLIPMTLAVLFIIFFVWLLVKPEGNVSEDINVIEYPDVTIEDVPAGKRVVQGTSGQIIINDVVNDAIEKYTGDVYVVEETSEYSIMYYAQGDHFLISILNANEIRFAQALAEESFLQKLDINKTDACALSVTVELPTYIDFMNSRSSGLSFCDGNNYLE